MDNSNNEKPKKSKPMFEEYIQMAIESLEPRTRATLYTDLLFTGLRATISALRLNLIAIHKENQGMFSKESDEFKKAQIDWWIMYRKLIGTRSFILFFYGFKEPNWEELMPEYQYCGVLHCKEDFEKFVMSPPEGSGLVKLDPINVDKPQVSDTLKKAAERYKKLEEVKEENIEQEVPFKKEQVSQGYKECKKVDLSSIIDKVEITNNGKVLDTMTNDDVEAGKAYESNLERL